MILENVATLEEIRHYRENRHLMLRGARHATGKLLQFCEDIVRSQALIARFLVPLTETLGDFVSETRSGVLVQELLDKTFPATALPQ